MSDHFTFTTFTSVDDLAKAIASAPGFRKFISLSSPESSVDFFSNGFQAVAVSTMEGTFSPFSSVHVTPYFDPDITLLDIVDFMSGCQCDDIAKTLGLPRSGDSPSDLVLVSSDSSSAIVRKDSLPSVIRAISSSQDLQDHYEEWRFL